MRRLSLLRFPLAIVLALSGIAKLVSGHAPEVMIGESGYFALAIIELLVAAGLAWHATARIAAWSVIALAAGGVWAAFTMEGHCGCLGVWLPLDRQQHVILAAVVGLLGTAVISGYQRHRSPDPAGGPAERATA
ncbi:MAG: hypothetical protein KDC98_18375 [Planctomycetes bacterium]|nr:hypothetical protein [Planctomycetota bacterium]